MVVEAGGGEISLISVHEAALYGPRLYSKCMMNMVMFNVIYHLLIHVYGKFVSIRLTTPVPWADDIPYHDAEFISLYLGHLTSDVLQKNLLMRLPATTAIGL